MGKIDLLDRRRVRDPASRCASSTPRRRRSAPTTPAARHATAAPPDEAMVRCERCGVFLPKTDARPAPDRAHLRRPGLQPAAMSARPPIMRASLRSPAAREQTVRRRPPLPLSPATPAGASCGSSGCTAPSARRCCSATALLLDLRTLQIPAPQAFVTASGFYFVFGLGAFWWIQRDRLLLPLPHPGVGRCWSATSCSSPW